MGIPKLIFALNEEGDVSLTARNNPSNIGGMAGSAIDNATGNRHNFEKTLGVTNDFVSLLATGGSSKNLEILFSNGSNTFSKASALLSQGAIFYDLLNNGGFIDAIEGDNFFNPREYCPDCIILDEVTIVGNRAN